MENLFKTQTVVEYLSKRAVPWEQAEKFLELPSPLSKSSEEISSFLAAAMKEHLSESGVMLDLNKRIKSGSGAAANALLDPMIASATSDGGLRAIARTVVEKASAMFENLANKGKQAGEQMDANTASYLRRKIFSETLVREIVKNVKDEYTKLRSKNAKDGFIFAFGPEDSEPLIDAETMGSLMSKGHCTVPLLKNEVRTSDILKELKRLEALMLFEKVPGTDQSVSWVDMTNPGREKDRMQSLLNLCSLMSRIPFELNGKKKDLMLQIAQFFQLSYGPICMRSDAKNNGRKITVIVPIVERDVVAVRLKEGTEITATPKRMEMIIINSSLTEYECPGSHFNVISFLTGP